MLLKIISGGIFKGTLAGVFVGLLCAPGIQTWSLWVAGYAAFGAILGLFIEIAIEFRKKCAVQKNQFVWMLASVQGSAWRHSLKAESIDKFKKYLLVQEAAAEASVKSRMVMRDFTIPVEERIRQFYELKERAENLTRLRDMMVGMGWAHGRARGTS